MEKENKIKLNINGVSFVLSIFLIVLFFYAIEFLSDQNEIRELQKQELKLKIKLKKLQLGEENEKI